VIFILQSYEPSLNLETLTTKYLAQVKKATDLLEQSFGSKNILRLWRAKKSREEAQSPTDVTYEPHGIDCSVYLSEVRVA
jgi:hypothetical protein